MSKNIRHRIFILVFLQAVILSVAFAQEDNSVSGNDLISTPYAENLRRWQNISEEQREAIRQKVQALDSQQREAIFKNAKQFKLLSWEEQSRIQGNYQEFKKLPNAKKELLKERNKRFQGFSPEERARLRREAKGKRGDPEDIRGFRKDLRDRREDGAGHRGDREGPNKDISDRGQSFNRILEKENNNSSSRQRGGFGISNRGLPGKNLERRSGSRGGPGASLERKPARRQDSGIGQSRHKRNAGLVSGSSGPRRGRDRRK